MRDYVHNHALQASLRVCHVNDMIKQMEANNRMSPAMPYTARCLTLFNPLWEGEGGGGRGREGEGGGEGNWYFMLCVTA